VHTESPLDNIIGETWQYDSERVDVVNGQVIFPPPGGWRFGGFFRKPTKNIYPENPVDPVKKEN